MSVISIFSGAFCGEDELVSALLERTGFRRVSDRDVVALAGQRSGLPEAKIAQAFSAKTSVFAAFTHEKERSTALLRLATAETLGDDDVIVHGFSSHLIPARITHVLRVCLIAESKVRLARAVARHDLSEKEALRRIRREDEDRAAWVETLRGNANPWDPALYDIVLPVDSTAPSAAVELITENLAKEVVQPTALSRRAVVDFVVSARVEEALAREGHAVDVECADGQVTLTINKNVLLLKRLEEDLKAVTDTVEGVESVVTRVGSGFHKTDIYRRFDLDTPSRVLLVDDEREFVQTLSERLQMRDVGSAIAYDGESALDLVREDEPDVMILDLKMPGIDGIEVLRQVKRTNPNIEVIILTGHGSDEDHRVCMELGAFAYLRKPVDIDALSETLKKANEKAWRSARSRDESRDDSSGAEG